MSLVQAWQSVTVSVSTDMAVTPPTNSVSRVSPTGFRRMPSCLLVVVSLLLLQRAESFTVAGRGNASTLSTGRTTFAVLRSSSDDVTVSWTYSPDTVVSGYSVAEYRVTCSRETQGGRSTHTVVSTTGDVVRWGGARKAGSLAS